MRTLQVLVCVVWGPLAPLFAGELDWLDAINVRLPEIGSTTLVNSILNGEQTLLYGARGAALLVNEQDIIKTNPSNSLSLIKGGGYVDGYWYLYHDGVFRSPNGFAWEKLSDADLDNSTMGFYAGELDGNPLFLRLTSNSVFYSSDAITWQESEDVFGEYLQEIDVPNGTIKPGPANFYLFIRVEDTFFLIFSRSVVSSFHGYSVFAAHYFRSSDGKSWEHFEVEQHPESDQGFLVVQEGPVEINVVGPPNYRLGELSPIVSGHENAIWLTQEGDVFKLSDSNEWETFHDQAFADSLDMTSAWLEGEILRASSLDGSIYVMDTGSSITDWKLESVYSKNFSSSIETVVFGNEIFLAKDYNGDLLKSLTGEQWQRVESPIGLPIQYLKLNGKRFITGNEETFAWSDDGLNWDSIESMRPLSEIVWAKDNFIKIADSPSVVGDLYSPSHSNSLYTSIDGIEWLERLRFRDKNDGILVSNGRTCFISQHTIETMVSFDGGETWQTSPYRNVEYKNAAKLFMANNPLEENQPSWALSFDGSNWLPIPSALGINLQEEEILKVTDHLRSLGFISKAKQDFDTMSAQDKEKFFHEFISFFRKLANTRGAYGTGSFINADFDALDPTEPLSLNDFAHRLPSFGSIMQTDENPVLQKGSFANLSSRSVSEGGENVQIGGFVINGSQPKNMLIRGVGPGIDQYGVSNYMQDPTIELYRDGQLIASNNDWEDGENAANIALAAEQAGAFELQPGSTDAAMLVTLDPGAYGFIVRGKQPQGIALAEMYDLDTATEGLFNMSSRSLVRSGEEIAIGGLIVSGERPVRIIVRGIGPGLASQEIENPLEDPVLEVYRDGEVFFSSNGLTDNSFENQKVLALSEAMNLIPAEKEDAALYLALPPGQYGFFLRSESGTEGVGLLELYKMPEGLMN